MPTYEYVCQTCHTPFDVRASVEEYEKGLKLRCPKCGANKAIRAFTGINILSGSRSNVPNPGGGCCGPSAPPGCCG